MATKRNDFDSEFMQMLRLMANMYTPPSALFLAFLEKSARLLLKRVRFRQSADK